MANLMHQHPNEGYVWDGHWWHDLNVVENSTSNSGNGSSNVTISIVCYSDGGAYTQSGTWQGEIWVDGGLVANTSASRNIGTGGVTIASWTGTINHDANGNATPYIEYYVNEPATSMSRRGSYWGLTHITRAASWSSSGVDTITTNSARIRNTAADWGIGTSHAMRMYYRVQGSGSAWAQTSDQTTSPTYWTITGLQPGKTYEYYGAQWNNNTSAVNGSTQTFQTKSGVKLIPPVGPVEDRVVKQILPTGVVSERVVTKVV
jgi:hypothetical protein